jgi:hypothetical protein
VSKSKGLVPMPAGGKGKKVLALLVLALVLVMVVKNPAGSAHTVHHIGSVIGDGADSLMTFATALFA